MQTLSLHPNARTTDTGLARERQNTSLCISIVCAIDGARFAAVAAEERECVAQVAAYVAEQAWWQLRPASARLVHDLLAAGDPAAAVAEYFRHTGERWEPEWLVTTRLHPGAPSGAWSGPVPFPDRPSRAG